jgi:hypothetical protein
MNDELVRELVDLQREQNALLKKHLWRLRFSLLTLLLLTTASAVCLGILMVKIRNQTAATSAGASVITLSGPSTLWSNSSAPTGTLRVNANVISPLPTIAPDLDTTPTSSFKE